MVCPFNFRSKKCLFINDGNRTQDPARGERRNRPASSQVGHRDYIDGPWRIIPLISYLQRLLCKEFIHKINSDGSGFRNPDHSPTKTPAPKRPATVANLLDRYN